MKTRHLCMMIIFIISMAASSAYGEWHFGIGTGPSWLKVDGDIGFHSNLLGQGVKMSVDADPDDISDVIDSAIGLGGYAANGRWLIQAEYGKLELEGVADNGTTRLELGFDITSAELLTSYMVYGNQVFKLNLVGGLRYTEHELSADLSHGGNRRVRNIDNDWTDVVVGVSAVVPFTPTLSWKTSLDAGFGGSEGTYTANTGLTWRFWRGWSGTLFYKYAAVEFENGSRGDTDWYLYDMDEQGLGLTILYNW